MQALLPRFTRPPQNAGDLIYVPSNWAHMTLNIGETIAVGGQGVYGAEVGAVIDGSRGFERVRWIMARVTGGRQMSQ